MDGDCLCDGNGRCIRLVGLWRWNTSVARQVATMQMITDDLLIYFNYLGTTVGASKPAKCPNLGGTNFEA